MPGSRHGLIRHHAVERPLAKDNFGKWTRQWREPHGAIAASFYDPDSSTDAKPPETSRCADSDGMFAGFSEEGNAMDMSR